MSVYQCLSKFVNVNTAIAFCNVKLSPGIIMMEVEKLAKFIFKLKYVNRSWLSYDNTFDPTFYINQFYLILFQTK